VLAGVRFAVEIDDRSDMKARRLLHRYHPLPRINHHLPHFTSLISRASFHEPHFMSLIYKRLLHLPVINPLDKDRTGEASNADSFERHCSYNDMDVG